MDKVWEGQVTNWNDWNGKGEPLAYAYDNCHSIRIEFPSRLNLRDTIGRVVEVRVKEPEPHICGSYKMFRESRGEPYWVLETSHYPSGVMAMGHVVNFCPNCGKKLE